MGWMGRELWLLERSGGIKSCLYLLVLSACLTLPPPPFNHPLPPSSTPLSTTPLLSPYLTHSSPPLLFFSSQFQVTVDLTEDGLKHRDDVVDIVFAYLHNLQREGGIPEYVRIS